MLKEFATYKEDKQYLKYLSDVEKQRQQNIQWLHENLNDTITNYPNQWIVLGYIEHLGYIGVKRAGHSLDEILEGLRLAQQLYPSDIITIGKFLGSLNPLESNSPLILNMHPSSLQSFSK